MRSNAFIYAFLSLFSIFSSPNLQGQEAHFHEYQVKAVFLLHFTYFVKWPASHFATSNSPLRLCVLGANPFQGKLEAALAEETVEGRAIQVHYLRQPLEARQCELVFLTTSAFSLLPTLLKAVQHHAVLTVGESPGFAKQGGMIGLYSEKQAIKFEINRQAAQQAHIKLHYKLLKLARIID